MVCLLGTSCCYLVYYRAYPPGTFTITRKGVGNTHIIILYSGNVSQIPLHVTGMFLACNMQEFGTFAMHVCMLCAYNMHMTCRDFECFQLMHVACDMHTTLYSQYCDMHVSLNMHGSCMQHAWKLHATCTLHARYFH